MSGKYSKEFFMEKMAGVLSERNHNISLKQLKTLIEKVEFEDPEAFLKIYLQEISGASFVLWLDAGREGSRSVIAQIAQGQTEKLALQAAVSEILKQK